MPKLTDFLKLMDLIVCKILGDHAGATASAAEQRGLVFKAHRLLYHSTLGLRLIKKKKRGTL